MKKQYLESRTYGFLVLIGIGLIILNIYIFFIKNSSSIGLNGELLEILVGVLIIILAVVNGFIAFRLNRSIIFWFIFSLIFSPIALIMLGTKKRYLKPELNKIYSQFESEYFLHKLRLRKELEKKRITTEEYEEKIKQTLKNLNDAMYKAMEVKENQLIADLNKEVVHRVEKTGEGEIKIAYSKCPACNSALGKNDFECPDCGLNLK